MVNSASRIIGGDTAVDPGMMATFEAELMLMGIGPLIGLWLQSFLIQVIVWALSIVIRIIKNESSGKAAGL